MYRRKRYSKAEPLYLKVNRYPSKKYSVKKNLDTADVMNDLAGMYVRRSQFDEAKTLLRKVFDILSRTSW